MAYKFKQIAPALVKLREQLNIIDPDRDKISDGGLGDARHAQLKSDHNPDEDGDVCAIDVTNNIVRGISGQQLVNALTANPDPRVNYLIFDKKITVKGSNLQKWKPYTGTNAHRHHVHISIFHDPKLKNSKRAWNLKGLEPVEKSDIAVVLPEGQYLSNPTGEPIPTPISQVETIPDEKPVPYNDIGLQQTLINDAKPIIPTVTTAGILDHISDLTGLPPIFIRIISVIFIIILVIVGIWLGYRLVSYIAHTIREIFRVRTNKLINANPDLKNVQPPPPTDKDVK